MKRSILLIIPICVCLMLPTILFSQSKKDAPKSIKKTPTCSSCHKDIQAVLPKNHKQVKGDGISICVSCHKPHLSAKAEPRPYASILHRTHIREGEVPDCLMCHTYTGNRIGIYGFKGTLGRAKKEDLEKLKDIFVSWSTSKYTDALHAKADIICSACHGKNLPVVGDTVDNDRCLACHGPLEALQKRSEPKDFPDRNPHHSHLGDIACSVCHKAHGPSTVYCLGCHGNFKMKIPGS